LKILYISDLDGTLLNDEKQVSEYSERVINNLIKDGIFFSIATARTAASATKILSKLDINVPVALMNGVAVYDLKKEQYLKVEPLPTPAVFEVLNVLKRFSLNGFMYEIDQVNLNAYYENLSSKAMQDFYEERVNFYYKSFKKVQCFMDIYNSKNIVYFAIIDSHENLSKAVDTLKLIDGIDMVLYKDNYAEDQWYLEIHSTNASKYNAANFIKMHCGVDRIIGFGDNYNDIPLLNACDEFYAVSNSVDELKSKANAVIESNMANGVARFISTHYKDSMLK